MNTSLIQAKQQLLEQMPVELQEIALAIENNDRIALKGELVLLRRVGVRLREVKENPAKYGEGAFKQIASFRNCGIDYLYKLVSLADSFSEEKVEKIAFQVTASSLHFTKSHMLELCAIESDTTRDKFLEDCLATSHTVRELRGKIASVKKARKAGSGRKPAKIRSVPTGLHQMNKVFNSYLNKSKVWKEDIFDELENLPPREFTDDVAANLKQLSIEAEKLRVFCEEIINHCILAKAHWESSGCKWSDVKQS